METRSFAASVEPDMVALADAIRPVLDTTGAAWQMHYSPGSVVIALEGSWAGVDIPAIEAAITAAEPGDDFAGAGRWFRQSAEGRVLVRLLAQYEGKQPADVRADIRTIIAALRGT